MRFVIGKILEKEGGNVFFAISIINFSLEDQRDRTRTQRCDYSACGQVRLMGKGLLGCIRDQ